MKKFRVGIIGCGRISVVYKSAFKMLSDRVEVCYAVDKDIARAKAFAAEFPGCFCPTPRTRIRRSPAYSEVRWCGRRAWAGRQRPHRRTG